MKKIKILNTLLPFLIGMLLVACSNDSNDEAGSWEEDEDIPVFVDLRDTPLPDGLSCHLYIFMKKTASATDYSLNSNYTMTGAQSRIKLLNKDLASNTYRFLFVATSSNNPEVSILGKDGSQLAENSLWNNVMIRANDEMVSDSNYYVILDKSGADILASGNIQATLTRLVGQMKFDIYKVKNQENEYITDTVTAAYNSVLDRVYKIEIEYFNRTKDIIFDSSNQPVHYSLWPDKYTQTIEPELMDASDLKINTAQITDNLFLSEVAKGSATIKGIYGMPSDENMEVKMTYYYYDTTPVCGDLVHAHSKDCFIPKTIELNLPKQDASMPKLSIKPNHYTVNSAKIRFNRVIDVGATVGFEFDSIWENDR